MSLIQVRDLSKAYRAHDGSPIEVLKKLNFEIEPGQTVAITGSSGSGKSTLLTLLAGLDHPDEGSILLKNQAIGGMTESALTDFRARHIGFIFQRFLLLPHFSALENVTFPLDLLGVEDARAKALTILEEVGLGERVQHFPTTLSGGECQRVAIARALVTAPDIVFADEPTGNLDNDTAERVTTIFFDLVKRRGITLVIVTHDQDLAERCDRQLKLSHGKLGSLA